MKYCTLYQCSNAPLPSTLQHHAALVFPHQWRVVLHETTARVCLLNMMQTCVMNMIKACVCDWRLLKATLPHMIWRTASDSVHVIMGKARL